MSIAQKVQQNLTEWSISKDACILLAISGGSDSICLAYILKELGYKIAFVHANFQLRGEESEAEHQFVADLAEKWGIGFYYERFDTQKQIDNSPDSLQVVARKLRYELFEKVMKISNVSYCATAHHADDNAETLLLNFIKGSTIQVMKGIPPIREKYIRPLLNVSKKEILRYLQEKGIAYKTDSSNLKSKYQRNILRNQIIPQIEAINPAFAENLIAKYHFYQLQNAFIQSIIAQYLPDGKDLSFHDFVAHHSNTFLDLFILAFLEKHQIVGKKALEICELKDKEVGKRIEIEDICVIRTREGISIVHKTTNLLYEIKEIHQNEHFILGNWQIEVEFPFQGDEETAFQLQRNVFFLDCDKLIFPLTFRSPKQGDSMQPLGMKGKKLISDIVTDNKFTAQQKSQAFVIEDAEQIVTLSDFRIADKVKIKAGTKKVLKVIAVTKV